MTETLYIIRSGSHDPYTNLACESLLFRHLDPETVVLFLYSNTDCVVIGRNQNPWLETDPSRLRSQKISLVRRFSGGGAVYQDRGNLNYCIIAAENRFNVTENFNMIISALRSLKITAALEANRDIMAGPYKISGNSFYYRRKTRLHHGTLLMESDLNRLEAALAPAHVRIDTHAVQSRRRTVRNIASIRPGISESQLSQAIIESIAMRYEHSVSVPVTEYIPEFETTVVSERSKYSSFGWIFGSTPGFRFRGKPVDPSSWPDADQPRNTGLSI